MSKKTNYKKIAYISVVHPLHDHRFLYKQCGGLVDDGFNIEYYVKAEEDCIINGVKIVALKEHSSRLKRFFSSFVVLPKLIKGRYHAVHLVDPELLPLGLLMKCLTKSKVVFDAHEDYIDFMKHKYYLPKWIRNFTSICMKLLLTVSGKVFDAFVFADEGTSKDYDLPDRKKIFFYNFPLKKMFPCSTKKWNERTYDIVFLGSMSRTSGTFVILESIAILKKEFPYIKSLFIGMPGDEIKEGVQEIIAQREIAENVDFTGRVPHAEVPALLQDCKLGLIALLDLPKFHKNIATKMFEYMASGIPVVSSDLPPERRFIEEGKTGLFFEPGSSESLVKCIKKVLSDEDMGARMHADCMNVMNEKGYYAESQIKNLAQFYRKLLN